MHDKISYLGRKLVEYIKVDCGKCPACLAKYQSQWSFRLEQEALYGGHASTLFVTLTYDNEHLPSDFGLHREEFESYIHRLRENIRYRYKGLEGYTFKYYLCGEYGSKRGRPHAHALLFFNKSVDWIIIQSSWSKGIVDIRSFTPARAGYVAKYSVKQVNKDYEGRPNPFHMQSNGLGACFLEGKSVDTLKNNLYWKNQSGRAVKLPRYYLEKLGKVRSRYVWKDDDGNVFTKSFSHDLPKFHVLKSRIRNDFIKDERIRVASMRDNWSLYYYTNAINSCTLEQSLIYRDDTQSAYAKLSRLGL